MKKKETIVLLALYDPGSFGVRTLHAVLKFRGFTVHSIFFKQSNPNNTMGRASDEDIAALIDLIVKLNPALVGISVLSALFELASVITAQIKKRLDTVVMWGGIHPTVRPLQSLDHADMICLGEGEEAMVETAANLLRGEPVDAVRNLWIRQGDTIIRNDVRPLISDLDSLPFPDVTGENKYFVDNGSVQEQFFQADLTGYPMMTSRGCFFQCTFCSTQLVKKIYKDKGPYVRRRSVDHVIGELKQAKSLFRRLKKVHFWDDVFTFDVEWIKEFCEQYKRTIDIPFFCYYHPKIIREETVKLLKNAGVEIMAAGIQSGSERISHTYFKRSVKNSDIVKAAHLLKKYEIDCAYDLILDNPLETEPDRKETLALLLSLPRPFEVYHATLTHFPETELTKLLLKKGMITERDVEDIRQKGYERWSLTLDLQRNKENLFWENLYFLSNKQYVPHWLVLLLSHCVILQKNPVPLTRMLRKLAPYLRTGTRSELLLENSAIMLGLPRQ